MPRIHTIDVARLTPLGQLIAEYMRQQWPRLQTKAELAHYIGVRPSTIDNLMYSQHAPSSRTLNKIAQATGIPATRIYETAAGIRLPAPLLPIEAAVPPQPYPRTPHQYEAQLRPRVAQREPNTALDEAIQRIRATEHPAMAEVMVQALLARAGQQDPRIYWQTRIREEHDHDLITTLEHPITPTAHTTDPDDAQPNAQPESQPTAAHI